MSARRPSRSAGTLPAAARRCTARSARRQRVERIAAPAPPARPAHGACSAICSSSASICCSRLGQRAFALVQLDVGVEAGRTRWRISASDLVALRQRALQHLALLDQAGELQVGARRRCSPAARARPAASASAARCAPIAASSAARLWPKKSSSQLAVELQGAAVADGAGQRRRVDAVLGVALAGGVERPGRAAGRRRRGRCRRWPPPARRAPATSAGSASRPAPGRSASQCSGRRSRATSRRQAAPQARRTTPALAGRPGWRSARCPSCWRSRPE